MSMASKLSQEQPTLGKVMSNWGKEGAGEEGCSVLGQATSLPQVAVG